MVTSLALDPIEGPGRMRRESLRQKRVERQRSFIKEQELNAVVQRPLETAVSLDTGSPTVKSPVVSPRSPKHALHPTASSSTTSSATPSSPSDLDLSGEMFSPLFFFVIVKYLH